MTCLEKQKIDYPELVQWAKENVGSEYFGCPHSFKYAPRPRECSPEHGCFISCRKCWDRELGEKE